MPRVLRTTSRVTPDVLSVVGAASSPPVFGTAEYFDRLAGELGDDFDWRALQRVRLDWCLSALARFGRPRYERALDLGCGYGHFSAMLALATASEVLGVDGAAGVVERASARYAHLRFQAGRLENLEFPEGRFDLICAVEVLYYLPPQALAVAQANLARWLVPGGDLLIAVRMKDTPSFRSAEAERLIPEGLRVVARENLRLGPMHAAEAFCARAVRWGHRRRLARLPLSFGERVGVRGAAALCGWPGWLRAGAALLRRCPGAAPTYRLWLARKPA